MGVTADSGVNQVTVSWKVAEEGESAAGFYIEAFGPGNFSEVVTVSSPANSAVVSGLRNGVEYSFRVTAATRNGASAASSMVSATPSTGMEGVVAGLIVEFAPGSEQQPGSVSVPGEDRVADVDLTISQKVTDNAVLVELSEPVDADTADRIARDLAADEDVVWAESDQFFFASTDGVAQAVSVPSDDRYTSEQWNLWDDYGIGVGSSSTAMTDAWAGARGEGITVAVIDTGITPHPDLETRIVSGYDFVSNPEKLASSRQSNAPPVPFDGDYIDVDTYGSLGRDSNPSDPGDWRDVTPTRTSSWHGTKMAGLIAAEANDIGIVGVAPGARIQPVRALSWRGGLLSDIAASITWASGGTIDGAPANATPSKVINMSFSVETTCPTTLQDAIDGALERGSILVAAAGNASDDAAKYAPGNCNGVITVGATNRDGTRANYSNYGSAIDMSAPGGEASLPVTTTSDSGTTSPEAHTTSGDYGTSVAAAHVSGAAAILASRSSSLTPSEAFTRLTGNEFTRAFANPTCDPVHPDYTCGTGILFLSEALAQIASYSNSTDRSIDLDPTQYQYAQAGLQDLRSAATVMAWVKPHSVRNPNPVIFAGNPSISINGSTSKWYASAMSGTAYTEATARLNEWQHVALTWNGSTLSMYVDGALAGSDNPPSPSGLNYGFLQISGSGSAKMDGDVDEVKVYSSVLTQAQIVTDMHSHGMNSSVSSANHVAYYDFNYTEATATTIENLVSGAASSTDLTAYGSPTYNDVASASTAGSTTTWTFDRSYLTAGGGWTVPAAAVTSNALIVGGGGGGGRATGGGGGGGGVLSYSAGNAPITAGSTVGVTVGMGGLGGSANIATAYAGQASVLAAVSAGGGGYGGASNTAGGDAPTGSPQRGSGGGAGTAGSGTRAGGSGTYSGGSSIEDPSYRAAAGGGGNSAVGTSGVNNTSSGGSGGAGTANSISGSSLVYGSGGGGAAKVTGGAGGSGAGTGGSAGAGTSGTSGRGSGGGGSGISGSAYTAAGSGGSGVVIVSYTTYTLSYIANGGSGTPPSSVSLTTGATTTVSSGSGLSRTGYTFAGWRTGASGGTSYAVGDTYTMGAGNASLYAHWIAIYTLSYNANGGTGTPPSSVSLTTGATTTVASGTGLSRTGYTFDGWKTGSSSGTSYSAGATFTMGSANVTLYAQWAPDTYNVTFDSQGGSSITSSSYTTGGSISNPGNPTRTGYTFNGWFVASSGGSALTFPYSPGTTSNLTLYAQWTIRNYNLAYTTMGATSGSPPLTTSVTYNSTATVAAGTGFSRPGYTFLYWRDPGSGTIYNAGSTITMPAYNVQLEAQWAAVSYTYSFDPNGGGNTPAGGTRYYGQSISGTCFGTSRGGYTLTGWQSSFDATVYSAATGCPSGFFALTGFTMPATNVVFTAQWTANTYAVTFDSKGGTSVSNGSYSTGGTLTEPTAPTKAGYTFGGWSLTDGGSPVTWIAGAYSPAGYGDFTMYALWIAYAVIYDDNGGSGGPGTLSEAPGATVTVSSTVPVRTGYTFTYWLSSLGGSVQAGDTFTMPSSNMSLTAQWTLIPAPTPAPVPTGSTSDSATASSTSVIVRPMLGEDGWEAIGSGLQIDVYPRGIENSVVPLESDDAMQVPRNGSLEISGSTYVSSSLITVTFLPADSPSTELVGDLVQVNADESGNFAINFPIDRNTSLGTHRLQIEGVTQYMGRQTITFEVTVFSDLPQVTTRLVREAAFYEGESLKFSKGGKQKINRIIKSIPQTASNVQVFVVGISVSLNNVDANLDLARDRAKKLASQLKNQGVAGTYTVSIATSFIIDGKQRMMLVKEDGSKFVSEQLVSDELLKPQMAGNGQPLTTVSVIYNSQ